MVYLFVVESTRSLGRPVRYGACRGKLSARPVSQPGRSLGVRSRTAGNGWARARMPSGSGLGEQALHKTSGML